MHHEIRKRGLVFSQINRLGLISLKTKKGLALVTTIWAIYLESILHNISYVGFLTGFYTFIGIFVSVLSVPILEKNSKTKIFSFSLIIFILSYFLFSVVSNLWIVLILGVVIAIFSVIRMNSFGIIIRDKSKDDSVSKNVGLIYTFFNIAWFVGPLIAGFLAEKYGLKVVFIASGLVLLATLILFNLFKIKDNRITKKTDGNFIKLIISFLKNKDRRKIYFLAGGITFWNTLIYVYLPIYIINTTGKDLLVGYFLSATIIPLILLEYYFGKLTGKIGFRKIFVLGYSIMSLAAISSFFIPNLYLILIIITLGGIGMAMLESTTESYFFDIVKKNERDKYYGPYNTTIEVNGLVASVAMAGALLILPFKFIFLVVGAMMLILTLISLRIKNIVEVKRH